MLAVAFPMLEEKIVHSVAEEAAFLVTVETALSEAALLVTVEIAHLAAVLASSHRAVQVVAVQAARLVARLVKVDAEPLVKVEGAH